MRREVVRWGLCAAAVATAHGCAWFALTTANVIADAGAGSPIVTLDLSPISAAPPPPLQDAQPDAPPDMQAPSPPPVAQADPTPVASPSPAPAVQEPIPTPAPSVEPTPALTREPVAPSTEPSSEPALPASNVLPDLQSDQPPPIPPLPLPLPSPDPTPETEKPTIVETAPQSLSPPPSAQPVEASATAVIAAAPTLAPGREAISTAELQSWQRDIIAQIERHKRFPTGARGRSGVAYVTFRIDRGGRLIDAHISSSSGSSILDQAALDLIHRSEPFPVLPSAFGDAELSFVAPVRYLPHASK